MSEIEKGQTNINQVMPILIHDLIDKYQHHSVTKDLPLSSGIPEAGLDKEELLLMLSSTSEVTSIGSLCPVFHNVRISSRLNG